MHGPGKLLQKPMADTQIMQLPVTGHHKRPRAPVFLRLKNTAVERRAKTKWLNVKYVIAAVTFHRVNQMMYNNKCEDKKRRG